MVFVLTGMPLDWEIPALKASITGEVTVLIMLAVMVRL